MSKRCSKCEEIKNLEAFGPSRTNNDGLRYWCRNCHKQYDADRAKTEKRKEQKRKAQAKYHTTEKGMATQDKYIQKPESRVARQQDAKEYRASEQGKANRDNNNKRPEVNWANRLRIMCRNRLVGPSKSKHTCEYIGCSFEELRGYFEKLFQPGMGWDNIKSWHIDHIFPLSKVDVKDPEQIRKAMHYTNMRPLWAKDNKQKSDKVTPEIWNEFMNRKLP